MSAEALALFSDDGVSGAGEIGVAAIDDGPEPRRAGRVLTRSAGQRQ